MNKFLTIIFLAIICSPIQAQIQGLSASKLTAFFVTTVEPGSAEFEPTYSSTYSKESDSDIIEVASQINWRMTIGLFEDLELGLNFPSDMSLGSVAMKAALVKKKSYQLGAFGGVNLPLGNRAYAHSFPTVDDIGTYGLGVVGTFDLDSLNSVDINVHFTDYFRTADLTSRTYFINLDYGTYSLSDEILLTAGAGYQTSVDYWNANLFLEYGVALEWNPKFAILFAGFNSIWTKGTPSTHGFNIAFTTFW